MYKNNTRIIGVLALSLFCLSQQSFGFEKPTVLRKRVPPVAKTTTTKKPKLSTPGEAGSHRALNDPAPAFNADHHPPAYKQHANGDHPPAFNADHHPPAYGEAHAQPQPPAYKPHANGQPVNHHPAPQDLPAYRPLLTQPVDYSKPEEPPKYKPLMRNPVSYAPEKPVKYRPLLNTPVDYSSTPNEGSSAPHKE